MRLNLRLELYSGTVAWRLFENADYATDHATLCRAFSLDPIRTSFDLPSTARGVGSASGRHSSARGIVNGLVLFAGEKGPEPIGTLTFVQQNERMPDVDPTNRSDFFNLNRKLA